MLGKGVEHIFASTKNMHTYKMQTLRTQLGTGRVDVHNHSIPALQLDTTVKLHFPDPVY